MRVIAMIPARYEASRFPGKLLKDLAGKSVIIRTYEATLNTELFDDVFVVTDSELISSEIKKHHGKVLLNQVQHKTGSDRIAEVATPIDTDIVINVQGDEPFVNKEVLQLLIRTLREDSSKEIDVASLIFPIQEKAAIRNPNNVKVVIDKEHFALYFSRAPIPYPREKNSVIYYQHIGIYAFRKDALLKFSQLPIGMLESTEKLENLRFITNGMKVKMLLTNQKSIGIDTPEDLVKANTLFKMNKRY